MRNRITAAVALNIEQVPAPRLASNDLKKGCGQINGHGQEHGGVLLTSSRTVQTSSRCLKGEVAHRINGLDVFVLAFRMGLRN